MWKKINYTKSFKVEEVITVKKNGDTFTAKVKAIGSQEYVEECLINLSMACHNLLPHQEPDIQFGAAYYADIREPEKSMENAVFSNTAARFDSGVPSSSAPAVDYDGFSRRQIFNDNCSQQSAVLGQASTSQAAFEAISSVYFIRPILRFLIVSWNRLRQLNFKPLMLKTFQMLSLVARLEIICLPYFSNEFVVKF